MMVEGWLEVMLQVMNLVLMSESCPVIGDVRISV